MKPLSSLALTIVALLTVDGFASSSLAAWKSKIRSYIGFNWNGENQLGTLLQMNDSLDQLAATWADTPETIEAELGSLALLMDRVDREVKAYGDSELKFRWAGMTHRLMAARNIKNATVDGEVMIVKPDGSPSDNRLLAPEDRVEAASAEASNAVAGMQANGELEFKDLYAIARVSEEQMPEQLCNEGFTYVQRRCVPNDQISNMDRDPDVGEAECRRRQAYWNETTQTCRYPVEWCEPGYFLRDNVCVHRDYISDLHSDCALQGGNFWSSWRCEISAEICEQNGGQWNQVTEDIGRCETGPEICAEAGGQWNERWGCKHIDSDGDGIADSQDACPNEGDGVDETGCPVKDITSTTMMEETSTTMMEETSTTMMEETSTTMPVTTTTLPAAEPTSTATPDSYPSATPIPYP